MSGKVCMRCALLVVQINIVLNSVRQVTAVWSDAPDAARPRGRLACVLCIPEIDHVTKV